MVVQVMLVKVAYQQLQVLQVLQEHQVQQV